MTAKGAPLVSSQIDQTVREYNGITGAFVRVAASSGALGHPLGVVIGVDGNLLVSNGQTNQVKRYDGSTGAFIEVFASTNLVGPTGMTIHHGALSVANSNPPQGVQRFDATTGVNTGNFVPSLANPSPRDEVAVEAAAGAGRDGGSARGDADEAGGGTRPRSHRVRLVDLEMDKESVGFSYPLNRQKLRRIRRRRGAICCAPTSPRTIPRCCGNTIPSSSPWRRRSRT